MMIEQKAGTEMAYGNGVRVEELRREIAEIQEINRIHKFCARTQAGREEHNKRNSRLREIQAELKQMMKKEPYLTPSRFGPASPLTRSKSD